LDAAKRVGLPLALVLFATGVYANTLRNGFALDDIHIILNNPMIRSLGDVPALFAADYLEPLDSRYYRPLTMTSYALSYAAGGAQPVGYHVVNVLLHALNSLLVLALFRCITTDRSVAAAGAFLFAAHAVHSEVVANATGRGELLSSGLFLTSLLCYVRSGGLPSGRLLGTGLLAYAAALLCKESAITLVGVLLLYDFVFLPGSEIRWGPRIARVVRARWKIYAAYLSVSLAYLGVRALVLEPGGPSSFTPHLNNPLIELPLVWQVVNALQVAFRYLWLLLFPLHLSSDYSFNQIPLITSLASPWGYAVVALSAASLWGVIRLHRISKPAFFAVGFALATFSIASNLVVSIGTIMAERLLYLPSIGFCLAAALAVRGLCERLFADARLARGVFAGVVAVVVILNGYRAHLRGADWFSNETLPLADLKTSPGSAKIHYNVAVVLFTREQRERDAALGHVRRALEIEPEYPKALLLLGHVLITQGERAGEIEAYERALRAGIKDAGLYNNLGYLIAEDRSDVARGIQLIEKAVELEPENPSYLDSLGWAYFQVGRAEEAYELIARSLAIDPEGASAASWRTHLAEVARALGRPPPAPPGPGPRSGMR
jgi:tetratricopeptide (TPR) repeat protein